jgi:sugar phosphate isomerase/epimerase
MNRRKLLLATLAAGAVPLVQNAAAAAAAVPRIPRPGIQLYTVRSEMQRDFRGTLAALARMGYREVEFAGYFEQKPADIRAMLTELGLSAPSAHVGDALFGADAQRTIDEARALGHRYLVCPWMPKEQWADLDAWKRRVDAFNQAGELCRKAGLQFAYHNHHFEFATVKGQRPYDILLAACDPQLVQMELDLYWAAAARQDPLALMRQHPGRFPMVHLKQLSGLPRITSGTDLLTLDMEDAHRTMADVGPGLIDFQALLADPAASSIRHFFVEHDAAKNPLESAANSLRFVQGLKTA